MEVAVAAYVAQFGTIEGIMVLEKVSQQWRRWARHHRLWRDRFRRMYYDEFAFLVGDQGEHADSQEWRLLCVQHNMDYSCGYHLGAPQQDEASMLRWIFVTRQAINRMSRNVADVLESSPPECKPLDEATYWQRSMEHLKRLQDNVGEWTAGEGGRHELHAKLADHVQTIKKLHHQAQWNAKYFKVLESPFRAILFTDMKHVPFVVTPMIKTLKMMWLSSKYYNDCFKMGGLLGRIAHALSVRVSRAISITALLHGDGDFQDTIDMVECAGVMLERWHQVYDPSSTVWGPFDMYMLFHRVDFVAQRCSEVRSALVLLRQIRTVLIEKVQNSDDASQIDEFEEMLRSMDTDLRRHWEGIDDLFADEHSAAWAHGIQSLRSHSDALLQFVHRLQDKIPIY
ncbi:hypothetical protein H310_12277 [Aphanomyces invadans]|uniref:Dynein heavy chain tail domain-containing protein n=1 Tax=Aphanomyces invadans TaxID=157072 RepID=A0A024TK23_9STRA|nr:hypothetical protein H310_12277 [Aphanomyces invadans]ETV93941.1 hypothetical protein H310_12277 [Aphanomyces invadans]|eukprot:XP_008877501.1 hypothetical protein H310_12277 [Aphanomyces invadans]